MDTLPLAVKIIIAILLVLFFTGALGFLALAAHAMEARDSDDGIEEGIGR